MTHAMGRGENTLRQRYAEALGSAEPQIEDMSPQMGGSDHSRQRLASKRQYDKAFNDNSFGEQSSRGRA